MDAVTPQISPFRSLQRLIREKNRKGLLPRELTALGYSRGQVDHALSRARRLGLITRVGQGIYAVGDARIAEVMPEVLPKLGYQILPSPKLDNYSIRRSGVTYRLDRPCHRFVMLNGVVATFETPNGGLTGLNPGKSLNTQEPPTAQEIDRHYRTFQYCHSPARAEKDMIVNRVLEVYDEYADPNMLLAIEGGTCLSQYQGAISRFSEDLNIRVVIDGESQKGVRELMRNVGVRLTEKFADELPFLQPTNKGRLRRDGIVHTLIFDYEGSVVHHDVVQGVKVELDATRLVQPLIHVVRNHRNCPVVAPLEILARKFIALGQRLPTISDSNPDLVRHVHDISAAATHITTQTDTFAPLIRDVSVDVSAVVNELSRPIWKEHYTSYMRRMGSLPTFEAERENIPRTHMAWTNVLTQFTSICRSLDVIGDEVVETVDSAVEEMLLRDGLQGIAPY